MPVQWVMPCLHWSLASPGDEVCRLPRRGWTTMTRTPIASASRRRSPPPRTRRRSESARFARAELRRRATTTTTAARATTRDGGWITAVVPSSRACARRRTHMLGGGLLRTHGECANGPLEVKGRGHLAHHIKRQQRHGRPVELRRRACTSPLMRPELPPRSHPLVLPQASRAPTPPAVAALAVWQMALLAAEARDSTTAARFDLWDGRAGVYYLRVAPRRAPPARVA